jgi:hypothetical protein
MSKIISFRSKEQSIDINTLPYKYAIPERPSIKLSDNSYLHIYRVTDFNDYSPSGDEDIEQDCFERECF